MCQWIICSELVFYFWASLSCFAIEWQLQAKGHCARLNETSRAALDPRVCLLPKFRERTLLERPQKEKKIGKKTKMSSGHRTAVVVHSPPLSARAIKAVCDCTLGAVNVKAVAGKKKKEKGGDTQGQVRSGMEEQSLLSGANRPAAATAGSRLARWSSESRNHFGGLLTAGGRPGGRWTISGKTTVHQVTHGVSSMDNRGCEVGTARKVNSLRSGGSLGVRGRGRRVLLCVFESHLSAQG